MPQSLVKKTVSNEETGFQTFQSTSYCLTGRTALGNKAGPGIIAVDPRFIALGSTVEILGLGIFKATDTGSAIKGRKIDLWLPCGKAIQWGRKLVKLRILPKKK